MKYPFHIQHNTTPMVLKVVLNSAFQQPVNIDDLVYELNQKRDTISHILPFVRQMGLIDKNNRISELGRRFHTLDEKLLPEAVHNLLYTSHFFDEEKHFSWAYSKIVDTLWKSEEKIINRSDLVGMIVEEASHVYKVSRDSIPFSQNSIGGAMNWIGALDPPVMRKEGNNEVFCRRYFCSVTTFFWAVDFIYRLTDTPYGTRLFLTDERIEQICRLCLLDPSGLDNVIMLSKRISDYERGGVFDHGTKGGFGRWLLLSKPAPLGTFP